VSASFAFERFVLDTGDRRLKANGDPIELNGRYFDALALLVADQGKLVSKDRFLSEVWRGVPVTDEALTQCIKTLRRQLGDDAANPRFIETVPKHGYRFIAPVECFGGSQRTDAKDRSTRSALLLGAAGTVGGGIAGFIGGLIYGFAGASQPAQPGIGEASIVLVLLFITVFAALLGGAGVGFGIALTAKDRSFGPLGIAGGAAGGLFVGAFFKLLGLDAFSLLVGQSPGNVTGAPEGFALGGATGFAIWLASRTVTSVRQSVLLAALCGAAAGVVISLSGGRLMLASLDLLTQHISGSRLQLGQISAFFGEASFGPITRTVTCALEGGLFAAGVVGAMLVARREIAVG
jgi:DNA-binding winged helix-turn-helix (wHTH) protein